MDLISMTRFRYCTMQYVSATAGLLRTIRLSGCSPKRECRIEIRRTHGTKTELKSIPGSRRPRQTIIKTEKGSTYKQEVSSLDCS